MRGKPPKEAKPPKPKIAVFGPAGAGKTWGSLDWPDCYFLDAEGGAALPHYVAKLEKAKALYVGVEDGANDAEVVLQEIKELATKPHDRKTAIIDSYTYLYNALLLKEYQRLVDKGQDPEGFFGRDKKPAIAFSKKLLSWIEKCDMNVLMICHCKDEWKDGKVVRQTFDGWEKCEYILNLIIHVSKQGTRRVARTTKSRFEQFPEGETFDWSYDVFRERFGHEVLESDAATITLASPAQVAELTGLIAAINFDKELCAKWLDKAGVDNWSEMATEDIQKCIDHLKSKLPAAVA